MKRVKLKRDMNHENRLTLANSGGRFCYEVTNYRVDKFSFSDKLLLTFFFFCSDFNTDICPCQNYTAGAVRRVSVIGSNKQRAFFMLGIYLFWIYKAVAFP